MAKSSEYWVRRALKREQESFAKGAELSMRLFKEYERAAREIRVKVNDFYSRYATENELSFDDAVKLLSRAEKQEWKASIGTWVRRINAEQDETVKAMLKAELDALSYNSQISRLEALYSQIQMDLNELYARGVEQMKEAYGDMFEEAYYKKVYDIQQRVGYINEFAKIDEGMIANIVSYPWSGADFSQRLWENKKVLHFHVRETITQGLILGKGTAQMTKDISDKMGSSFKNAERLIRTETTHFHAEANKTAYAAAGIEQYEYMATLDMRTSGVCRGLDGKHFKLSEAQAGVNYPPMHPWCRSTTIEYDPEDALDWYNSGQPMPDQMTYEDWRGSQVDEMGEERVKAEESKVKNKASDAKLYKQYKDVLGDDAPKNLQSFQEMKYNDSESYQELKELVAYKERVPDASKTDFAHYKAIKATGVKGVPIVPAPNIDVSGFDFDDEHIADRSHGVTREQAESFIRNARFALSKWKGKFLNFYSDDGAAFVNLGEKKIRTAFTSAEYDDAVKKMMEVFKDG